MRLSRRWHLPALLAAAAVAGAGFLVAGCSTVQPSIAQCAIVTGHGAFSNQQIQSIARPGEKIHTGSGNTIWYFPCNARNYVTAPSGGDRSNPMSVRTAGQGNEPGVPVYVWTAVYWQVNQSSKALRAFFPFCLKYGCASNRDQTTSSNQDNAHFATPGWNGMLRENFGPALDRATADVIQQFPPNLWTDHADWGKLGDAIAQALPAELEKATGSKIPFFCGTASTPSRCAPMQVVVNNVTPADPQVATIYNQQVESTYASQANQARLNAAKALYGPWANWFLGVQDSIRQCEQAKGCTVYLGNPPAHP